MSGVAGLAPLYLVPMAFIPTDVIAYHQGDFIPLWNGHGGVNQQHDKDEDEHDEESAANNRSTKTNSISFSPTSHIVA